MAISVSASSSTATSSPRTSHDVDTEPPSDFERLRRRERQLVHERDAALERAEIVGARLHAMEERFKLYLGVKCDACGTELGVSASSPGREGALAAGLAGTLLMSGWRMSRATIMSLAELSGQPIAVQSHLERDTCLACVQKQAEAERQTSNPLINAYNTRSEE